MSGNATDPLGNMTAFAASSVVAAVPTSAMILGSMLVVYCRPTEIVKACLQNLSAGIILAAIAGELFPLLTVPDGGDPWLTCAAIFVGFAAGAGLMFSLEVLLEKCNPDDDDDDDDGDDDGNAAGDAAGGNYSRRASLEEGLMADAAGAPSSSAAGAGPRTDLLPPELQQRVATTFNDMKKCLDQIEEVADRTAMDFIVHRVRAYLDDCKRQVEREPTVLSPAEHAELVRPLVKTRETIAHLDGHFAKEFCHASSVRKHLKELEDGMVALHDRVERPPSKRRRWSVLPPVDSDPEEVHAKPEKLPMSLVLAVSVDAFVDGFLIGLSYVANFRAGFVMAGATCVEMGFLGVSYCASLLATRRPLSQVVWLVLLPPVMLVVGGCIAGAVGAAIEGTEFFTGFIALAVVALFFLVTQELLIEANENLGGKDIPWVNLMLFVGILLVVLVQNLVG